MLPTIATIASPTVPYNTSAVLAAVAVAGAGSGAIAGYRWHSTARGALHDVDGYQGAFTDTLTIADVRCVCAT